MPSQYYLFGIAAKAPMMDLAKFSASKISIYWLGNVVSNLDCRERW